MTMRKIVASWSDAAPLFRHGGASFAPALDFSVNLNPLGPPASVLTALRAALPAVGRYPDPTCRELTHHLAEWHGVDPCQIVVGNGSSELIHALPRAVAARRVAIVEPTYTEYLRAARRAGAEVDHWLPTIDSLIPQPFDPQGTDVVWLGNPNNPTGYVWPPDVLEQWIDDFPETIFVIDESFQLFAEIGATPRGRGMMDSSVRVAYREHTRTDEVPKIQDGKKLHRNCIRIRSLTKYYALPGLRLGYAIAPPDLARRLREQLVPWSVNSLAQVAGLAALADEDYARRTAAWFHSSAPTALVRQLCEMREWLEPLATATIFMLVHLRAMSAAKLTRALAARGIAIRDASNFIGLDDAYVRLAMRLPAENDRLLDALRQVFQEG
ncbi:MAG: pyridoxal phosphate-dependent aminotransferase [Gemmataceae bacterium]